ncbi:MAG: c-type cytochrome [Proteobacteria bacterium]|nr:c-type cytochrome [Pseudomonadota bacterium]
MKKIATCISGIMFLAMSGVQLSGAVETKTDANDGRVLFEKKCSVCHNLEKSTSKKKTPAEWEKTVKRMIESRGAKINDEEAKVIVDYLAKNYGK